ncbi:protein max [Anopheles ziemanni]|uniref:protein max n=1 Tax=Anopheles coustani TaxID=139045 RepID=UPI0026591488|nr:protein max [Anopheles coustani]XP_058130658.1 protein max [Anopheles coustani]XP_058172685.1 protein max [Anopheles ziemanni]
MRLHEENQGRKLSTSEWYDNMMSDDDRDIDIESDDGDDSDNTKSQSRIGGGHFYSQAEKRAHHNALERKRRDHIKDSFTSLRDSVPSLQGEKASRAQILKKAAEYIQFMRRKNNSHQQDIDDLRRQNNQLETQIRHLEQARATGNFVDGADLGLSLNDSSRESDSSDVDEVVNNNNNGLGARRNKKMKTNSSY